MPKNEDIVDLYCGCPITELTREELMKAVVCFGNLYRDLLEENLERVDINKTWK